MPKKTRNPIARDLGTPKYRRRVVPGKKTPPPEPDQEFLSRIDQLAAQADEASLKGGPGLGSLSKEDRRTALFDAPPHPYDPMDMPPFLAPPVRKLGD